MRSGNSRLRWAVVLGSPLAFGVWSLLAGQDTNWDLRNYHWYNGYALLNGRAELDAAPAGLQTYFSPLVDLLWYGLGQWLPGRGVGFIIGAVQSANFVLLYLLGLRLLPVETPVERELAALLVAVTGVCGAAVTTEIGTTMNDAVVSIGVLFSLLLVVRWWPTLMGGPRRDAILRAMAAGLTVGVAFSSKATMGTFAAGLAAGFLVAPCPMRRRMTLAGGYAAGVAVASAILLGPWLGHVWQQTGNPIFPYLNGFFRSPLASLEIGWFNWERPRSVIDVLLFPLRFIGFGPRVMELPFHDYRVAMTYVVVPALLVLAAALKARRPAAPPTADGYLFFSMLLAYGCWMAAFSYYRYLVPLEMLAPLLIALAILRVPAPRPAQRAAVALAMVLLLVTSHAADYGRASWGDHFVAVKTPALARPDASVVLLLGQPTAFVVPSFPPSVRFLQLTPNFALSEDPALPWHRLMQARIDAHHGDLHAILIGQDMAPPRARLAGYGLALVEDGCRPLEANLTISPEESLRFCPVVRRATAPGAVTPP
jgi:hypothetical protein